MSDEKKIIEKVKEQAAKGGAFIQPSARSLGKIESLLQPHQVNALQKMKERK